MLLQLFDLLSELTKNPNKAKEFNENPSAFLARYSIDGDVIALLTNTNSLQYEGVNQSELYGRLAP